jgi:hypothetical protein
LPGASGLRAEAEAYAASHGLRRGTPGWGDAIRDYVRQIRSAVAEAATEAARRGAPSRRRPLPPPRISERDRQAAQSLLPPSQRDLPPRDISLGGLLRESREAMPGGPGPWDRRRSPAVPRKDEPSFEDQFAAILVQEDGLNPDGTFRRSSAGALGPAQIKPDTAPEAAKLAFLPYDDGLFRTARWYNEALGRAYYADQLDEFEDPAKAAAAYNRGPTRFRSILKEAERAGEADDWERYLPRETREYVRAFRIRLGLPDEDLPAPSTAGAR